MAKKPFSGKTTLTIDNAPVIKKPSAIPTQKLGLIYKQNTKKRAYRFRVETIEALTELTESANKKVNIKLSMTNVIELLILDAAKHPDTLIKLIEG